MKYNAANSAYHDCVRVRTEVVMSGGAVSLDQLEREAAALRTLNQIRTLRATRRRASGLTVD